MVVKQELENMKLQTLHVAMGEVEIKKPLTEKLKLILNRNLKVLGFELLDDQKTQLIEQIKNLLIQKVQSGNVEEHFSLTKFIGEKVFKDYSSISKLFSELEGITLEQFFNLQKIEKVKEWLAYNEQTLTQIAYNLGYSSTQHVSSQFKRITGMTPSQFKQLGEKHRKSVDAVKE